ncbi:MAG: hypothetical protein K8S98_04280 [Planctomycetes bacterium]|nr:hypothetical protein [Planctomycetota bacterium]
MSSLAFCALAAFGFAPQDPVAFGEGPLENQTEFETSKAAEEFFSDADLRLVALRASTPSRSDRERAINAVFDAWHDAVGACSSDEWVRPDPALQLHGTSGSSHDETTKLRRAEGAEFALLARLAQLDANDRARWTARFEARAKEELDRSGSDREVWQRIERTYPGTSSAARAALRIADAAFAEVRLELVHASLERAARHAAFLGADGAPFVAAIERRNAALARVELPPAAAPTNAVDGARGFGPVRALLYDRDFAAVLGRARLDANGREDELQLWLAPGAVFLASGALLVQSNDLVAVFPANGDETATTFRPSSLLRELGLGVGAAPVRCRVPGRRLTPIALGNDALVTVGEVGPNSRCAVVRLALATGVLDVDAPPTVRWATSGTSVADGRGRSTRFPDELALDELQFEPGPVVFSTELVLLARSTPPDAAELDDAVTWAVALDLATGRPLWKRRLARGPIGPRTAVKRFEQAANIDTAPLELLALDDRVFAGTSTGFGVLFDAADGRLVWSVKNRRRKAEDSGWRGRRPWALSDGELLWPPVDSDRGYRLRARPDVEGNGLFAATPFEIGELRTILGANGSTVLAVLASDAGERLATIDLERGTRTVSLALPPKDAFGPEAWVTTSRIVAVTDRGLALFDRTRELFLQDRVELGAPVAAVLASPKGLVALGGGVVWRIALR